MQITLSGNFGVERSNVSDYDLYSFLAGKLSKIDAPDTVSVATDYGNAEFEVVKKGHTSFIREAYNHIQTPISGCYDPVYLVCVNPEYNNYKFYQLEDIGNDQILATYGRIGVSSGEIYGERTHIYPKRMYWIKLMEKLKKGYKDMSDVYLSNKENSDNQPEQNHSEKMENKPETVSMRLYNMLRAYSRHVVKTSCLSVKVTKEMVKQAKRLLTELYSENSDIEEFNKKLIELLSVSPRRVRNVKDLLAVSVNDFAKIISREENLLMAMEAVSGSADTNTSDESEDGFEREHIEVYEATEEQRNKVIGHLSDQLKPMVKNVYRVIHPEHKKRFNDYLKSRNISCVKEIWHGSRNENWLSIISNGLLLKPNAVITGKMFGNGIYFAPSSMKSWGYTSYHNTYWARGNADVAFMGLYACAFGKPKDVTMSGWYSQEVLDREGFDCVYAHAGVSLRNDEIVFYNESAMLLNYIVEFGS